MSKHEEERYSHEEIINTLSLFGIKISKPDLVKPTSNFVCNLYNAILDHIDALPKKEEPNNEQLDFEEITRFDNPEHHADSVPYVKLCHMMKHFLAALRCSSFNLRDLITPDPDRTQDFLSMILNFCIYRDAKMKEMEQVETETDSLAEQKLHLENVKAQLEAQIVELNESIEGEMPLVEESNAKVNELRQTILKLNNHQLSLKATKRKLMETAQEIEKKITAAEFTLVQSVQENANLLSKVVQSPDKLQRTLEEKKMVQAEAKNAERAARQSFQDTSTTFEVYTKACTKMSKHLAQMQALQDQVNSAKSVEKELKSLKSKLSDEAMIVKSLESRLIEMQGKGDELEELKNHVEKERETSCSEALKELNNVKSEVESQRRDLALRKRQVEAVITEADSVMANINSVRSSGAAKQQEIDRKCEEVMEQFYKYSSDVCYLLPISEKADLVCRNNSGLI